MKHSAQLVEVKRLASLPYTQRVLGFRIHILNGASCGSMCVLQRLTL